MKKSEIHTIQSALKDKGKYTGIIDGIRGMQTNEAIQRFLTENTSMIEDSNWFKWSAKRKSVASLQLLCLENNIEVGKIDGLYGPQTDAASELLAQLRTYGEIQRGFVDIVPIHCCPVNLRRKRSDSYQLDTMSFRTTC